MNCCNNCCNHEFNLDWFLSEFKRVIGEWDGTKEWLENWLAKQDIPDMIKEQLQKWLDDGTIERLINDVIFEKLNSDVGELQGNMNSVLNDVNKLKTQGLNGKRVAFFGDSLTYGENVVSKTQSPRNIPKVFSELTGASVDNFGVNGMTATDGENSLVRTISQKDLTVYDYIFINIGVNDFLQQKDQGFIDSANINNFWGACDTIFKYLVKNQTSKNKIIALSFFPNHEIWNEWFDKIPWLTYKTIFDNVAFKYNIPIIDTVRSSGICKENMNVFMAEDGLHFTDSGYELLAKTIATSLSSGNFYDITAGMGENEIKPWSFQNDWNRDAMTGFGKYIGDQLIPLANVERATIEQYSFRGDEVVVRFTLAAHTTTKYIMLGFSGYPLLCILKVSQGTHEYIAKFKNTEGNSGYYSWAFKADSPHVDAGCSWLTRVSINYGRGEYIPREIAHHYSVEVPFESGVSSDASKCRVTQRDFEVSLNGYFYNSSRSLPSNTNILNLAGFKMVVPEIKAKTYVFVCGGTDGKTYVFNAEGGMVKNITPIPQNIIIGLNAVIPQ